MTLRRFFMLTAAFALTTSVAQADDLKIALIYGKTGPLEAYAKQTETGLRMGFEYATKGTMMVAYSKPGCAWVSNTPPR
eukprot:gene639-890_t